MEVSDHQHKSEATKDFETYIKDICASFGCCTMSRKSSSDAAAKRDTQAMKFVFTVNGLKDDHEAYKAIEMWTQSEDGEPPLASWVVVAPETAPTTGMPHMQGFVLLNKKMRELQIVKALKAIWEPEEYHPFVEKANGTLEDQYKYVSGLCEKKGNVLNPGFKEYGTRPSFVANQGEREKQDWDEAYQMAAHGRLDEIDAHKYICNINAFKQIAVDCMSKRPLKALAGPCGEWHHGEAGTGKTHSQYMRFPNAYRKNPNKWFCGYAARGDAEQGPVIIEDVDKDNGSHMGWFLKIWADEKPFLGETKGSSETIPCGYRCLYPHPQ